MVRRYNAITLAVNAISATEVIMHTSIYTLNYTIELITKHSIQCCSHNAIIAIKGGRC